MRPVIIIGDSLGCPRPWQGVGLTDTYAYRLQCLLGPEYYVTNWAVSDNNSRRATSESFLRTYVRASSAGHAIVQLGIVDCAPRLMSAIERLIGGLASRVPGLRAINAAYVRLKVRHRYTLTRLFPRTMISRDEYESNMRKLVGEMLELPTLEKIFLISIARAGAILIEKSYGIEENIRQYNAVLSAIAAENPDRVVLVDLHAKTENHFDWITVDDGHHIHAPAHEWIAHQIAGHIRGQSADSLVTGNNA